MAQQRERTRNPQREEERRIRREEEKAQKLSDWIPKTEAGKLVKNKEIETLNDFFAKGYKVMEPELVDILVPDLKETMIDFKKTTKVTRQGRNFSFRAAVIVGDGESYIGLGTAKDKEKFPAINKATRNAKLNLKKIIRGSGSWEERSKGTHSIPFKVTGKSSSVRVHLIPAPRGTGLVVGDKIKEVMKFVGIKDIWSKTEGNTRTTLDFVTAAIDALHSTNKFRVSDDIAQKLGIQKW